jgi:methylase of polypeptide subunit release factors
LQSNAARVVATDINPAAIANAAYNADRLGYSSRAEWILADRTEPAFAPLSRARGVAEQRFDVILSNPPWESKSTSADLPDQYALYDPNWILLDEILERSANHLAPNGELLLAYGAKEPILRILDRGPALGWTIAMLDERSLDDLPEVFLPGMLIRLTRSAVE